MLPLMLAISDADEGLTGSEETPSWKGPPGRTAQLPSAFLRGDGRGCGGRGGRGRGLLNL